MTAIAIAPPRLHNPVAASHRLTGGRVLRAEWFKLTHLRSTWIMLALMVVCGVGLNTLMAGVTPLDLEGAVLDTTTVTGSVMGSCLSIGLIFAVIMGALTITAEYGSGSIRSTLAVVPRPGRLLAAKAAVAAGLVCVWTALSAAVSLTLCIVIASSRGADVGFDAALTARLALGLLVAMAGLTVITTCIGALLRSSAGAISSAFGLFWVVPMLLFALPVKALRTVSNYLPGNLANDLVATDRVTDVVGGVGGAAALFIAWVALFAVAAGLRISRSDS